MLRFQQSLSSEAEMVDAISSWPVTHPLWAWVIGTVVGGLIAAWVTLAWPTILKFCALPPQKLNVRILKARIAGVETKIVWIKLIQEDLRYLLFQCFFGIIFLVLGQGSFCMALTTDVLAHVEDSMLHSSHLSIFTHVSSLFRRGPL
jgi:hypothetical protein